MSDIERRLRELSGQARAEVSALAPDGKALRRIRIRRVIAASTVVLSLVGVVAGGVYASTTLVGEDRAAPPVHRPSPAPLVSQCGYPLEFEPDYVPRGFSDEPRPVVDDGPGKPIARYTGGRFASIQVWQDSIPGLALSQRERIRVLGRPAVLASIHEGYAVTFEFGSCDYALEAYGVERDDLEKFAERLTVPGVMTMTPLYESPPPSGFAGAIWPEDTEAAANSACGSFQDLRADAMSVVLEFGNTVLGWKEAVAYEAPGGPEVELQLRRSGAHLGERLRGQVRVFTKEVSPGCWSVVGVSRPPDNRPTSVTIQVQDRRARVGFASLSAASASVQVGYGGRAVTAAWESGDPQPVEVDLGFDPDTTGHYLILLEDARGRVFSAVGGALPRGDFGSG